MSKFLWVFIPVLFALRAAQAACPHGVKVAAPAHAEAVLYFAPVSVTDSLYTHLPQKTDSAMHAAITIATFSTISTSGKFAANPFISGSIGKFYFENRYNYEAANSASVNIGRQLNTPFAGFAVTPMVGLVAGGFKGLTSEVQAYNNSKHWYLSLDNQYTFNYAATRRSFYYNWLVARLKLMPFFQIGLTTQFLKPVNKKGVFDRGVTTSVLYRNLAFNVYAFNFEPGRRNFFVSLRYSLRLN